ncbi:MAG: GNAT family N-acetyltransferase [Caulobacteraceae bacterium]
MGETIGRPKIDTARLNLRPTRTGDAPRMAALADDFDVARMTTSIPHPFALADAEGFIARMDKKNPAREVAFAIDAAGEGLIGVLGFHPNATGAVEVGYWLGRPFWGLGYATEAASAAMAWAATAWRRRFVVSGHFADNPASGRVLCKTGFLYTGEVTARWSVARAADAATRMMIWLA